jgi:RNA polymerase sigma-70 factor (ECF subfamily)
MSVVLVPALQFGNGPPKTMVSDPDSELVQAVASGDGKAARVLMSRHLPMVLNLARRMLDAQDEAEDVAQEVFTKVWTHAARWQPGAALFKTWLHRVAINLCYDRLRKRKTIGLEAAEHVVDGGVDPAENVYRGQLTAHVDRALADLPLRQKEAVVMVHYQGMSNIDAAAVMEISVDALESLLSRGRRTLRTKLLYLAPALVGQLDGREG